MAIKWKKSRALCSLAAFAAGTGLVLGNLLPAAAMGYVLREQGFSGPADYQKNAEFRYIIEERLSDLLGVAAGGHSWYTGGVYTQYGYDVDAAGWLNGSFVTGEAANRVVVEENAPKTTDVTEAATEETVVEQSAEDAAWSDFAARYNELYQELGLPGGDERMEAYLEEQALVYGDVFINDYVNNYVNRYYDGYSSENESDYGIYRDEEGNLDWDRMLDAYLWGLDQDKNLRYAIVSKGELQYTNIDSLTEKTGTAWDGSDLAKALPGEVYPGEPYNFQLWYNREGDGKVQILKDGVEQDVYGDGVYRSGNDWRVPGYANFTLGGAAKDAVIFLAAAKTPQLYLVGNYEGDGVSQYGGNLYYLSESVKCWDWKFKQSCIYLIAGAGLLLLALLSRKSLGRAFGGITKILGKIPLPVKTVMFMLIFVGSLIPCADAIGQMSWYLRDALYIGGDAIYLQKYLFQAGIGVIIWFWLILWAVADGRANVGRQIREMAERRRMRDLKYPVQRRLVKRDRRRVAAESGVLMVFIAALLFLYILFESYIRVNFWAWQGEPGLEDLLKFPFYVIMAAFLTLSVFVVFVGLDLYRLRKSRRLAEDIGALSDRIAAVKNGAFTEELRFPEDSDLREAAENLNGIQKGMEKAIAEQVKSERMKVDLVTNVSHDIKTPLTSIISYVELLRQEEELPAHVKEYVQILGEKSERLRSIVQDVFEVSKATSGQLPIQIETLDMGKLLRQTLADMDGLIERSPLVMKISVPQEPVCVQADGQRLYRVFQNLLQNALRYSLEGSRVYLTLTREEKEVVVRIRNTSATELPDDKDFTERFVRGDESRTDGGSGLGLSIAKSFTQACGGSFAVETNADLFTATVRFAEVLPEQTETTPEGEAESKEQEGLEESESAEENAGTSQEAGTV